MGGNYVRKHLSLVKQQIPSVIVKDVAKGPLFYTLNKNFIT